MDNMGLILENSIEPPRRQKRQGNHLVGNNMALTDKVNDLGFASWAIKPPIPAYPVSNLLFFLAARNAVFRLIQEAS
jgi:hypothetical protein